MNGALASTGPLARVAAQRTRRAGFIIPSSNRRFEPEASAFLPAGITPHVARARITVAAHDVQPPMPLILDAARCLADARCELVFLHCTALSMGLGPVGERQMLAALGAASGTAVGATGLAVRLALSALGVRRVSIVTPYGRTATDDEAHYLQACGFGIADTRAFELGGSDDYCATPPAFWGQALRTLRDGGDAGDAVLLSCANIRCLEILDAIDTAADRPVVTSNQAALWYAARMLGDVAPMPALGCLASLPLDNQLGALTTAWPTVQQQETR